MKKCPKCAAQYFDDTLEFCLEDGSRLLETARTTNKIPVASDLQEKFADDFKTEILPEIKTKDAELDKFGQIPQTTELSEIGSDRSVLKIKEKVAYQGLRFVEVLPVIIALFHNYWHWLYFDKARFGDLFKFLISGAFLIWILLLISGVTASLIALKYGKNRGFAIVALVILAINLLLGLVPLK